MMQMTHPQAKGVNKYIFTQIDHKVTDRGTVVFTCKMANKYIAQQAVDTMALIVKHLVGNGVWSLFKPGVKELYASKLKTGANGQLITLNAYQMEGTRQQLKAQQDDEDTDEMREVFEQLELQQEESGVVMPEEMVIGNIGFLLHDITNKQSGPDASIQSQSVFTKDTLMPIQLDQLIARKTEDG